MKEKELQRLVLAEARKQSWNVAHFGNSVKFVRRGDKYLTIPDRDAVGFPDLVMVREGRLIFAELKGEKGRIRDEQALWLADLNHVMDRCEQLELRLVDVYVWRPEHWPGAIKWALA